MPGNRFIGRFIGRDILGGTKPYGPGWVWNLGIGECVFGKFEEEAMAFHR